MPRTFTTKEREYVAHLVVRNIDDEYDGDDEDGLETPMPAAERMRRKRIRDKAQTAIQDVVMVELAGVLDEPVTKQVEDHNLMAALVLPDADAEDRFERVIGRPSQSVNISNGSSGDAQIKIATDDE